jgi:hypothetical protein
MFQLHIYVYVYCDMTPEKQNSGAREMAVVREQLGKHIIFAT